MRSSHKSEFLTLLEPAVILREGSKAITQRDLVKYPSLVSTPLTPDLQSATGQKAKPSFIRQKNVSGTGHQKRSKNLARTLGPTLNINKRVWELPGSVAYGDDVLTPGPPTAFQNSLHKDMVCIWLAACEGADAGTEHGVFHHHHVQASSWDTRSWK